MEKNQSKVFIHAEQRGLRHCEETEVSVIARKQRSPSLRGAQRRSNPYDSCLPQDVVVKGVCPRHRIKLRSLRLRSVSLTFLSEPDFPK